jgi:hypothetical protein
MLSLTHRAVVAISALVLACACVHATEPYGIDLHGQPVSQLAGPGIRVVVLVFAASDCPISNRYVPEIARLNQEFSPRGVRIWWVFPNSDDTAPIIAKHNTEFAISESTVLDSRQMLVRLAHVDITPEAAVFAVDGNVLRQIYRGRIDDRYLSIGRERPQPDRHDLEAAIAAALAGESAPKPSGPAVGCSIIPLQK